MGEPRQGQEITKLPPLFPTGFTVAMLTTTPPSNEGTAEGTLADLVSPCLAEVQGRTQRDIPGRW